MNFENFCILFTRFRKNILTTNLIFNFKEVVIRKQKFVVKKFKSHNWDIKRLTINFCMLNDKTLNDKTLNDNIFRDE